MAGVGGSVATVTLDGRIFSVASDADTQRKLGGFENEIMANGDGTARVIKTRVPWSFEGAAVDIDDDRDDQTFLQDLADRNGFFPVGIEFASGRVFQGTGQITGETQYGNQNATATLALGGIGRLTPQ